MAIGFKAEQNRGCERERVSGAGGHITERERVRVLSLSPRDCPVCPETRSRHTKG